MFKKVRNSNDTKPLELEHDEIDRVYFVRKDFEEITIVEEDESTHKVWEYMENIVPEEDWESYQRIIMNTADIEKNESHIQYVAIMTDVDLPTGE